MATAVRPQTELMRTLPTDAVRQIQWRFADRFELQMLVHRRARRRPRTRRPPCCRRRT